MTWKDVTDKEAPAGNWVVADSNGNECASGNGLNSLLAAFEKDKVQFAAIRVVGVDEQENVVSNRPKIVRVNWVGPNVSIMAKSKALQGKQIMSDKWPGCAAEVSAGADDLVDMNSIAVQLLAAGGAHKPTKYDFGDGSIPLSEVKNRG